MSQPDACTIEIIERVNRSPEDLTGASSVIVPNEIRINGKPVLAPADDPVIVHGIEIPGDGIVKVTLTLFAKRITVAHEVK